MGNFVSLGLGCLDQVFRLANILPGSSRKKFFTKGYGDLKLYDNYRDRFLATFNNHGSRLKRLTEIEWSKLPSSSFVREDKSIVVTEGRFESPMSQYLPDGSKTATFQLVKPAVQSKGKRDVFVIMLPATGEMGKSTRMCLARSLAMEHGWSSIILTAAYYGKRKPCGQHSFFLQTVKDGLFQSQSIIEEAVLLAGYFMDGNDDNEQGGAAEKSNRLVCFTGYSYGGAMAAVSAGLSLRMGLSGEQIACASYVGSASPVVFADGLLQTCVDFKALQKNVDESVEGTRQGLYDELVKTQLTSVTKDFTTDDENKGPFPPQQSLAVVKLYAARNDAFIRPVYALELARQLGSITSPANPLTMEWLWGGHITAAIVRPFYQKKLVVDTVLELLSHQQKAKNDNDDDVSACKGTLD